MTTETKKYPFFSPGAFIFLGLFIAGAFAMFQRFTLGLGATTNMSDTVPWGMWIAADVLAGVALAAGGFTVTAGVYIFNMKKYKPIARPAILTAFIGYILAASGILIDLGKPLAIYHPLLYPQLTSVLFEVAMCVMIYLAVLALEFSPAVWERFNMTGMQKFFKLITFPLVILGICLSFMHQSSLGALYLIMPARLSELWYSPVMNFQFYTQAIVAGLAMTNFETIISHWSYKKEQVPEINEGLAKGTLIALLVFGTFRIGTLAYMGNLGLAFDGSRAGNSFLFEFALGVLVPVLMLALPAIRKSVGGCLLASSLVVVGVVVHRFNVNFFAQVDINTKGYSPTMYEILGTTALVSLGVLIYRFCVTNFPIFYEGKH